MQTFSQPVPITDSLTLGAGRLVVFAGPCAAESQALCEEIAGTLQPLCQELAIDLVFKASFDKANRTSGTSYRGQGLEGGLRILAHIKKTFGLPVVTDVHESHQCAEVAAVADVLQIPAFLCRQTDLLVAAARTGRAVKIKKGQFMAPEDMQYAVAKVREQGNARVFLTERGSSFGYHNLVVDMRSLPIMRQYTPVVFDVTHSVQRPGGLGGQSGGDRQFAPFLARAAAAAGVDGFFIETHPRPAEALSDGPNLVPLAEMRGFLEKLKVLWTIAR